MLHLLKLAPLALLAATLHAQSSEQTPEPKPAEPPAPVSTRNVAGRHPSEQTWPSYRSTGDHLDIVTLAEPTLRHTCTIKHWKDDSVTCRGVHGAKPVTYKSSDVLALIDPPTHATVWHRIGFIALGAGLIAATPFIPVTGIAVLLQVVGGISAFGGSIAFIDDPSDDHDDDVIVYQRANSTLAIPLNPGK